MRIAMITLLTFVLAASGAAAQPVLGTQTQTAAPDYAVDTVATDIAWPWSFAFLPDGSTLITEKHGGVRLLRNGQLAASAIGGGPQNVLQLRDSGLLDIVPDPDFESNREVYIAFAEGTAEANRLVLWKGLFDGEGFVDGRVIFRVSTDKRDPGHPGGRIAFLPDRTLLLTVGDGYDYRDKAQDRRSYLGKVLRLDRDGKAPKDNPFFVKPYSQAEIFSWGHRNPQGLLVDPRDGSIWLHEHGPKGGDEINRLSSGANYGWPRTTHGIDYSGEVISPLKSAPEIESPALVWLPSIAPSGFALYLGNGFPAWRGDFFVGALVDKALIRVRFRDGRFVEQEKLLSEIGARVRDVRTGPDGHLYVLTDEEHGRLLRVRPK